MRAPGRRAMLAIGIIALWTVGLGVLVQRELFRPHTEQLAEAGLRVTPSATFFAVLQHGEQIGFASSTVDTTDGGIAQDDYLVADLPIGGKLHRASARSSVQLTRALRLRSFTFEVDAGLAPINAHGRVEGDSMLLITVNGVPDQPADTQRIRLTGPIIPPTVLPIAIALGPRPKPGATVTLPVFDPATMTPRDVQVHVDAESLFVLPDSSVFNRATQRWNGVRRDTGRAWKLTAAPAGGHSSTGGFHGWVDEQGRVVVLQQLLGLTLERRPYEVAFENWKADARARGANVTADQDVLETTAIAASKRLRDGLGELRVRLSGVSLDGFEVKGYRQRLVGDTLIVTREGPAALAAKYQLPNGAGNPEIRSLASRRRGAERNPAVVAERINRWVYDSLRKEITVGVPSALATLRSREGDCNEHTQLYVAVARAAGIPARVAAGLAFVDGKFYYHAWPEVWLERWVAVDPTFGQFPADASHLRFTVGGLGRQAALLRLMGALHIDVVSAH